jgi:hypothetical protein
MNRFALASSLLSVSLVGCGTTDPKVMDMPDPDDTTSPSIVSVTPAAGAAGVAADAQIVITFSEAMDRGTVEQAYASQQLPASAVSMAWNDAGDTLTIHPDQPMVLAEGFGNDPTAVAAKAYMLTLAATASDLAGNPLDKSLELGFATQKRMSTTAGIDADLTRYRVSNGGVAPVGTDLRIGDNASLTYRGFVTFDLSKLPSGAQIEEATIAVRQLASVGTPFALGALDAAHITYATVNSVAWNAAALDTMGSLTMDGAAGPRALDVSAAVAEDYDHRIERANHSQYRLEFPTANNGDGDEDTITFATATFELSLVYIAP